MRIFALETDIDKLNTSFLSPGESIVLQARFHGFIFAIQAALALFVTIILTGLYVGGIYAGVTQQILIPVFFIAWVFFVLRPLLRAYIDWQYDELLVTTEKIVIVNQSSIVRQEIEQMNLENLASVRALTQYMGLLPFGRLHFELKEGVGQGKRLKYIPNAQIVCSQIGDCLVQFQRRKNMR